MEDSTGVPRTSALRIRAALITVQLCFGVHYLVAKVIVTTVDPAAWACLRALGAAAVMIVVTAGLRRRLPPARDCLALAGCAFFGILLNQALFLEGLSRTTPAHAALICAQIPAFSLAFAILLRQESASLRTGLCFACGLAGVMILLEVDRFDFARESLRGDLLCLGNALSYGLFLVLSRRIMARNDPIAATTVIFAAGSVFMLFYGGDEMLRIDFSKLSTGVLGAMSYAVIGATVVTYFLNLWALKRARASQVAIYIFLQPVVATVLGIWLLGNQITPRFIAATLLVLAALLLRDQTFLKRRPTIDHN